MDVCIFKILLFSPVNAIQLIFAKVMTWEDLATKDLAWENVDQEFVTKIETVQVRKEAQR